MRILVALLTILFGQPLLAAQFSRPSADTVIENCTLSSGADSFALINDDLHSGYVSCEPGCSSDDCGSCSASSATLVKLSSVTDPVSSSGHILRVGCLSGSEVIVTLYQGFYSSMIALTACDGSLTDHEQSYTLSGSETDSISDYANIYVELQLSTSCDDSGCTGGCTAFAAGGVSYVSLEVPSIGGGAARRVVVVQ